MRFIYREIDTVTQQYNAISLNVIYFIIALNVRLALLRDVVTCFVSQIKFRFEFCNEFNLITFHGFSENEAKNKIE